MNRKFCLVLALLVLFSFPVFSAISSEFSFQGVLTTADGNFVNSDVNMIIRLYAGSSGGSTIHVDTNAVTVSNGYFSTIVGDANTLDVNFVDSVWLTLQTKLTSAGSYDTEMSPRIKITPSPQSLSTTKTGDLNVTGSIVGNASLVKIGSSSARTDLNISRDLNASRVFVAGTVILGSATAVTLSDGDLNTSGNIILNGYINVKSYLTGNVSGSGTTVSLGRRGTALADLNVAGDLNVSGGLLNLSRFSNIIVDGNLVLGTATANGLGLGDLNLSGNLFGGSDNLVSVGSSTVRNDLNVSRDLNASNITATGSLGVGNAVGLLLGLAAGDVNIGGVFYLSGTTSSLTFTGAGTGTITANNPTASNPNLIRIGGPVIPNDLNVSRDLNASRLFSSVLFPLNLSVLFVGSLAVPVDLNVTGDLNVAGDVNFAGGVSAVAFFGSGAGLTNLPTADINSTVVNPSIVVVGTSTGWSGLGSGDLNLSGRIFGGSDNLVSIGSSTVRNDLNVSKDLNSTRLFTGTIFGLNLSNLNIGTNSTATDLNVSGKIMVGPTALSASSVDGGDIVVEDNIFVGSPANTSSLNAGDISLSGNAYVDGDLRLRGGDILDDTATNIIKIGSSGDPTDLNVSRDLNASNIYIPGFVIMGTALASSAGAGDFITSGRIYTANISSFNASLSAGDIGINGDIYLRGGDILDDSSTNAIRIGSNTDLTDLNVSKDLNASHVQVHGDLRVKQRILGAKGADVSSGNSITLGNGNYFDITGTSTIDCVSIAGWTAGSQVMLQFDSAAAVTNNGSCGGSGAVDLNVNFNASSGDILTLVTDGTNWFEVTRSVN
ncbi:MAG: hypothetical protein Q7S92_01360 [Candidatus Diapherotrites archaeon]|nr:hypothetical protein [Candidatus Diapherotrites archaeon]